MLSVALFAVAFAGTGCGLPSDIDPDSTCETDSNGFSTLDADSVSNSKISLSIHKKGVTTDAFGKSHDATKGKLSCSLDAPSGSDCAIDSELATNGRYVLHCPQKTDKKTVMMTVARPARLTAFGGEWVQLFPKDSWENTTNEYEPFTFNHYGAKIPLPEFRSTPTGLEPGLAPVQGSLAKYKDSSCASNSCTSASRSDCDAAASAQRHGSRTNVLILDRSSYPAGCTYNTENGWIWNPHPAVDPDKLCEAIWPSHTGSDTVYCACVCPPPEAGLSLQNADGTRTEVANNGVLNSDSAAAATTDYVNVYMEVSNEGDYEVMYGNPGLKHNDFWVAVQFKSTLLRVGTPWAECSDAAVLASKTYDVGIIMPILFGGPNTNSIALRANSPSYLDVIKELQGVTVPVKVVLEIFTTSTVGGESKKRTYTDSNNDDQCYKAGNTCPEKHLVCKPEFCEMDVWKSLIASFKAAGSSTCGAGGNEACVTVLGLVGAGITKSDYDTLGDPGVGWKNTLCPDTSTLCDGNTQRGSAGAAMDGFYFQCEEKGQAQWSSGSECTIEAGFVGTSVLALGSPLFDQSFLDRANEDGASARDNTKVDAATVYVTLASDQMGSWNPFAWYPYVAPSKWAAILTDRSDVSADVATLFDRGYGWVYLTSEIGLHTKSTITKQLIAAVTAEAKKGKKIRRLRKLEARRLEASWPFWGCDDTLFECKPICLKQHGHVTSKVSSKLCAGAPMDQCACKCYHEAQWTCEGDSVVCKAKFAAGELQTVGDKVCEMRGAPKPMSPGELRDAGIQVTSMCEPMKEMRGSAPTAECLAQWSGAKVASEDQLYEEWLRESFAVAVALGALGLYA